jgi:hypothetical protein
MTENKLIKWIVRWCTRPGMYLVGPSDKGQPDVGNLLLLIHAYFAGTGHLADDGYDAALGEWKQFERWIALRRPHYFRETWFGNSVLEEFKRLAEEYLSTQAAEPG